MGYTHYFTFKKAPKGQALKVEKAYQKAISECAKVIRHYQINQTDSASRLSGYTAHTKPGAYGGIELNGKGDLAHEAFILREHYNQNEGFNFVKTARKPYDLVVVACLAILQYRLGDLVEISSDGLPSELTDGTMLARKVLRLNIINPLHKSKTEWTSAIGA